MEKTLSIALLASVLFNIWAIYATGKMQEVMVGLSDTHAEVHEELMNCQVSRIEAVKLQYTAEGELNFCLSTLEARGIGSK